MDDKELFVLGICGGIMSLKIVYNQSVNTGLKQLLQVAQHPSKASFAAIDADVRAFFVWSFAVVGLLILTSINANMGLAIALLLLTGVMLEYANNILAFVRNKLP